MRREHDANVLVGQRRSHRRRRVQDPIHTVGAVIRRVVGVTGTFYPHPGVGQITRVNLRSLGGNWPATSGPIGRSPEASFDPVFACRIGRVILRLDRQWHHIEV